MTEPKTKTINGKEYKVAPFMAVEAFKLKAHLMKLLGAPIAEFMLLKNGMDSDVKELIPIIEGVFNTLNEDTFLDLVKRMLRNTTVSWTSNGEGKFLSFGNDFETTFNLAFENEVFSIYEVLGFVLQVNYPDFFSKNLLGIGLKTKTTSTSSGEVKK